MRPHTELIACLSIASPVSAAVFFLNTNWTGITVGQPYNLYWAGDDLPVNISLQYGPVDNLQWVRNITVNNANKSFTYLPKDFNLAGRYALRLHQENHTYTSPGFFMNTLIAHLPESMGSLPDAAAASAAAARLGALFPLGIASEDRTAGSNEGNSDGSVPKLNISITRRRHDDGGDEGDDGGDTTDDTTNNGDDIRGNEVSNDKDNSGDRPNDTAINAGRYANPSSALSYNPGGLIVNATASPASIFRKLAVVTPSSSSLLSTPSDALSNTSLLPAANMSTQGGSTLMSTGSPVMSSLLPSPRVANATNGNVTAGSVTSVVSSCTSECMANPSPSIMPPPKIVNAAASVSGGIPGTFWGILGAATLILSL